jgi:hypothetical protein
MANKTIRTAKKKAVSKTDYVPVAQNIYKSNESYRVRLTINGERYSKNFTSETKARKWRNEMIRTEGAAA